MALGPAAPAHLALGPGGGTRTSPCRPLPHANPALALQDASQEQYPQQGRGPVQVPDQHQDRGAAGGASRHGRQGPFGGGLHLIRPEMTRAVQAASRGQGLNLSPLVHSGASQAKAIVFSQFTSMLDLCQFRLEQTGVSCVKLEGSMSLEQRDRVLDRFTRDPDVRVLLMSLKAGGVALNLTCASHVFLMDLWWNPAVEQQAQDRIHRMGQYKPVRVTRIVIGGTVEERILKLQEKKQLVFDGTVGRDNDALGRLTPEDLKFLFQ